MRADLYEVSKDGATFRTKSDIIGIPSPSAPVLAFVVSEGSLGSKEIAYNQVIVYAEPGDVSQRQAYIKSSVRVYHDVDSLLRHEPFDGASEDMWKLRAYFETARWCHRAEWRKLRIIVADVNKW
jgi:hypothetical protein